MNKQTEKIKNEIRTLYNDPQKKPANVAKEYPELYLKARRIFGSWKKALEACGIDYEKARTRKKWSREKVAKEIKKLHLKGHSLRPNDLRKEGMISLISAAQYHFGSWRRAVESTGVYYSFGRGKKIIKDDTEIRQITRYSFNLIHN